MSCQLALPIIPPLRPPSPTVASMWQKSQTWVSSAAPVGVTECWQDSHTLYIQMRFALSIVWQSCSVSIMAYFAFHYSGYFNHPLLSKSLTLSFRTLLPNH